MTTAATLTRPHVLSASTLQGDAVKNLTRESLGKIEDFMIDLATGRTKEHAFILNVDKERLKNAPGFDKNTWPDMTDREWGATIYGFYEVTPYWEE